MLDRLSGSAAFTTIIAVLAKFALLYRASSESWFTTAVDPSVVNILLVAVFLIFLRGKMMHDDSVFFSDLEHGKFGERTLDKAAVKTGLLVGYLSWICWAPVIYFMEKPRPMAWWLVATLALSTVWLVLDIVTRKLHDRDYEAKKRLWFVLVNVVYCVILVIMANSVCPAVALSGMLLLVLAVDWLALDPFSRFA